MDVEPTCNTVIIHSVADAELRMISHLQDQYIERRMLDLLIHVDGEVLSAHRCVIAAYMKKAVITSGKSGCTYNLHIPKLSVDAVRSLIGQIYFGRLECDPFKVAQVQVAANQLGYEEAEEACRKYLERVSMKEGDNNDFLSDVSVKQEPVDTGDYGVPENMSEQTEMGGLGLVSHRDNNMFVNSYNNSHYTEKIKQPEPKRNKKGRFLKSCNKKKKGTKDKVKVHFKKPTPDELGNVRRSARSKTPMVYADESSEEIEEEESEDSEDEEVVTDVITTKIKMESNTSLNDDKALEPASDLPSQDIGTAPRFTNLATRTPQVVDYEDRIVCVGTSRSVGIGDSGTSEDDSDSSSEEEGIPVPKLRILPGNQLPNNTKSKYALPRVVEIGAPYGKKMNSTDQISSTVTEVRVFPTKPVVLAMKRRRDSILTNDDLDELDKLWEAQQREKKRKKKHPKETESVYVDKGVKSSNTVIYPTQTGMETKPNTSEFIVYPTKPVVKPCIGGRSRPSSDYLPPDVQLTSNPQPTPVFLVKSNANSLKHIKDD